MRAIPEEKLQEYIAEVGESGVVYAASLVNLLEEIDTLTVSKLRPMGDARDEQDAYDKRILVSYVDYPGIFHVVEQNGSKYWSDGEDDYHSDNEFLGWLPMPTYEPATTA